MLPEHENHEIAEDAEFELSIMLQTSSDLMGAFECPCAVMPSHQGSLSLEN